MKFNDISLKCFQKFLPPETSTNLPNFVSPLILRILIETSISLIVKNISNLSFSIKMFSPPYPKKEKQNVEAEL